MSVFVNARVFDGESPQLLERHNVFVSGDRIAEVSPRPPDPADGEVIDCGGRVLLPGLIDAHIHAHAMSVDFYENVDAPPTLSGEHGTLIEPDTARMVVDHDASIVPTMAVIHALAVEGKALGYPAQSLAKLEQVKDQAVARLQHMKDAGVRVGYGTDLLGSTERFQCEEFRLRSAVYSPLEILRQATSNNAEIIGMKGRLGVVRPGAWADLLVADGDPTRDIEVLADDGRRLSLIMRGGVVHRNRLVH